MSYTHFANGQVLLSIFPPWPLNDSLFFPIYLLRIDAIVDLRKNAL